MTQETLLQKSFASARKKAPYEEVRPAGRYYYDETLFATFSEISDGTDRLSARDAVQQGHVTAWLKYVLPHGVPFHIGLSGEKLSGKMGLGRKALLERIDNLKRNEIWPSQSMEALRHLDARILELRQSAGMTGEIIELRRA